MGDVPTGFGKSSRKGSFDGADMGSSSAPKPPCFKKAALPPPAGAELRLEGPGSEFNDQGDPGPIAFKKRARPPPEGTVVVRTLGVEPMMETPYDSHFKKQAVPPPGVAGSAPAESSDPREEPLHPGRESAFHKRAKMLSRLSGEARAGFKKSEGSLIQESE